jgi:hypothetical protein
MYETSGYWPNIGKYKFHLLGGVISENHNFKIYGLFQSKIPNIDLVKEMKGLDIKIIQYPFGFVYIAIRC